MEKEKSGVLWAIFAYLIWGLLPVYWKSIDNVPSAEILVSRIVWAFISTLLLILLIEKRSILNRRFKNTLENSSSIFGCYFLHQYLISGNWFLYIWAVNHGYHCSSEPRLLYKST